MENLERKVAMLYGKVGCLVSGLGLITIAIAESMKYANILDKKSAEEIGIYGAIFAISGGLVGLPKLIQYLRRAN